MNSKIKHLGIFNRTNANSLTVSGIFLIEAGAGQGSRTIREQNGLS